MKYRSHYDWLKQHLPGVFAQVGASWENNAGIIVAHGDKGSSYRDRWAAHGIPYEHGMAVYLLSYVRPFAQEVRETAAGWVDPCEWVIRAYPRFQPHLPAVEP